VIGPNVSCTTAQSFDLEPAARALRWALASAKPDGAYAVFYDPCCVPGEGPRSTPGHPVLQATAIGRARDELRAQVRDFIEWLRAEGVI
jgi:hypothetical protein